MGGSERKGAWTVPKEMVAIAVMGGIHLDFRDARFGPGLSEVKCFAMMGGLEIVVPPGVHVEMNGLPLMGGFAHRSFADPPTDPNAPVLRVSGVAIMGGVDLTVRYSGESERQAKARDRLAQREQRRLTRGR
jgi:hypothetical protein